MTDSPLRRIPAVEALLRSQTGAALCAEFSRAEVAAAVRVHLDALRRSVRAGTQTLPDFADPALFAAVRAELLARRLSSLRRCINATGIILHTNLGRAPLAPEAREALEALACGYSNVELDLAEGRRGARHDHVETLLRRITGAESAHVVNNGAAAVLLALRALAAGGDVIVSRGELIEIGGSFRMPDVIAQSGARLVEVGTTNRTHRADYARALTESGRVLLSSHRSNFQLVGFTTRPRLAELAQLAHEHGAMLIEDLGSGSLVDLAPFGLPEEPTVQASLAAGVDVLTFSGDKLLGGPQAGIILGRAAALDTIRRHPLARAVRIDKLSLAALEATLRLYLPPHDPCARIPVLRMLTEAEASVARRARALWRRLARVPGLTGSVAADVSYAGGGALPMSAIPTRVVRLRAAPFDAMEFARRLRAHEPPVVVRIAGDAVRIDPRTLLPGDADAVHAAVRAVLA